LSSNNKNCILRLIAQCKHVTKCFDNHPPPTTRHNSNITNITAPMCPFCCFKGIQEYFLLRLASDDQQSANYRSLIEGQNYLSSGWVGKIMHTLPDDKHIVLKGPVRFSQTINNTHTVQITLERKNGKVVDVHCDCMANRGKCCSHTAGLLYKLKDAVSRGFTGTACTDQLCAWNQSTWTNVVPDTIENIQGPDHEGTSMKAISMAFETDAQVIQHFSSPELAGLAMIPGSILHQVLTAHPQKKATNELPRWHEQCAEHKCNLCNVVYEKYVKCGKDEREKIKKQNQRARIVNFGCTKEKLGLPAVRHQAYPKKQTQVTG